ncbi:unnamed protein product [Urochloa humidicola]
MAGAALHGESRHPGRHAVSSRHWGVGAAATQNRTIARWGPRQHGSCEHQRKGAQRPRRTCPFGVRLQSC